MQKIKDYIGRFFKSKKMDRNFELTTSAMIAFIEEMSFADANKLFYTIPVLFRYGYVKGYRAAKAEMKKAGVAYEK